MCRRPCHCRRQKRSTTRHRRWQLRSSTSATYSRTWALHRSQTHQCMRTTLHASSNHVIGGRQLAKHIDIRKHFAHETIQNRQMRLIKVNTSNQLADIFTKPLQLPQFLSCWEGILLGQRAVELPPTGPRDSGGGKQSPSTQARGWALKASGSKTSDSKASDSRD